MEHAQLAGRDDVRDGRLAEQDRHLAEEVTLAQARDLVAIDLDRDLAVDDHVEARAGKTLAQDALAGRIRLLGHLVRHGLDLRPRQVGEERQTAESVSTSSAGSWPWLAPAVAG